MAFSFNPGQIAPPGGQSPGAITAPSAGTPGLQPGGVAGPVSNPKSPFLFMHDRDKPITLMACLQIALMALTVVSIVTSVIVYSYSLYLTSSINTLKTKLNTKEEAVKEYPLLEMKRLSNRFSKLEKLLESYISPRSPFKFLENVVENQVYFSEFALNQNLSGIGYFINFSVVTSNYRSLIQQLAALNLKEYKKVVPTPAPGEIQTTGEGVKVFVTTPVFVQGKLPEEMVFIDNETKSPALPTSTSTP